MESNYENKENQVNAEDIGAGIKDIFGKMIDLLKKICRMRLVIRKDDQVKKDIPLIACGIFAMISFRLTVAVAVIGLLCGYTANVKGN